MLNLIITSLPSENNRVGAELWSSRIKWPHSSGVPFAVFAPLRLGENLSLNEEAHFSQRRKGAKWRHLFLKDHYSSRDE
jgi:hypothetical protein